MAIFKLQPLRKKSLLQRFFRQEPLENAIIELNNLLAGNKPLAIRQGQLQAIENRYRLKLNQAFSLNLQEFYAVRWNDWLKTGLSDAPIEEELDHWADLFGLPNAIRQLLIQLIGEAWYSERLDVLLKKKQISMAQEAELESLRGRLQLKESTAEKMYDEKRLHILETAAKPFIQRERLSPTEEMVLRTLAADLRMRPKALQPLSNRLLLFKQYWQLENEALPVIETSTALQKNEVCHFRAAQVSWLETRAVGRGFSHLEQVNFGTLYLTNKRLVFEGQMKNSVLPYERIRRISQTPQGIQLQKDKGKDPVIKLTDDAAAFHILIKRLINL